MNAAAMMITEPPMKLNVSLDYQQGKGHQVDVCCSSPAHSCAHAKFGRHWSDDL